MDITGLEALVASNPDALALVKDLGGKAAKFTPELEADLAKLPEYKGHHAAMAKILETTKAKDADTLMTDFTNLKTINADLVRQKEQWKADGKGKESPEYLQLLEQIEANKTATQAIKDELKAANEKTAASEVSKRETDMKASIIAAASKGKANDPEDVAILLKARGLTGFKEDGKPFFNKLNEAGQMVACTTAEEAVTAFLDKRKDLVGATGARGTGGRHQGGAGGGAPEVTSRAAARANFKQVRTGA